MFTASIVIRCYNEEKHIGRLLGGIMEQTIKDVEIIVVDSGSTDATVSIVSKYPVKIISIRPEEFSFGKALNIGCQAATGETIVIASAHVYPVYKDWLEQLLAPFVNPDVALVYGKQRGNEITKYSEHQVFAKWFPEQSNLSQKHPFCNNANATIRKSLWEQLPYDEELTGLEDIDWARRAIQKGCKIAYSAQAEIIHVHQETPTNIYNRYRREAIALKHIFPQEHFNFFDFVRLFLGNVVSDWYHAWYDRLLRKNMLEIFVFRLMQFWGTYQGFLQQGPVTSKLKQTFYYPNGWKRSQAVASPTQNSRRIKYANATGEK
ncbi:glycosyltransferase [Okeania sp. SIO2B3]|uniref:glycosyltransferase family 2 protein n=1 Tax=Okeania sp. SIO2B3 TaxID=2607784 RepID=UPI0013C134B1|nr:glycosyltransferase [Okeania sp. SIO2B3]NET41050.1 glycosyltransferase [Okeania sp. SIO2B3]